ncbi:unnamed protein product [Clonostachys solani]|uniref:Uncharacterized protein n=1 Tax=Clonostachys solani TaxID=160281 RepID=A0A9N9Z6L5_9HYPO|nr:unnamed protein product [Clonostachys solani]
MANKPSGTDKGTLASLDEANQNPPTGSVAMKRFQAEGIDESPWNPLRVVMASESSKADEANKSTKTATDGSTAATQGSAPKS